MKIQELAPRRAGLFYYYYYFNLFFIFISSQLPWLFSHYTSCQVQILQERYCLLWCGCGAQASVDIHLFIEKCISTSSSVWFSIDRILVGVSVCSLVFFHFTHRFCVLPLPTKVVIPCISRMCQNINTMANTNPQVCRPTGWFVIAGADCKAMIRSFS